MKTPTYNSITLLVKYVVEVEFNSEEMKKLQNFQYFIIVMLLLLSRNSIKYIRFCQGNLQVFFCS